MPSRVAASMPLKTVVPMARRLPAPAPVAITMGTTPRIKVKEVINTGRKRIFAPSSAAFAYRKSLPPAVFGKLHDKNCVFGGQTDQQDKADLGVDTKVEPCYPQTGQPP